jgi:hypothetical protein
LIFVDACGPETFSPTVQTRAPNVQTTAPNVEPPKKPKKKKS